MKLMAAIKFILIFSPFSGMSCEETIPEPTFTIGSNSDFHVNRLYYSSDGDYTLLINEIGDSRCPEGAECFWQGEVYLKGEWNENKQKTNIELHSVLKDQQKEPDGFTIEIIDVKPYPKMGIETEPEDKLITLLIKRK